MVFIAHTVIEQFTILAEYCNIGVYRINRVLRPYSRRRFRMPRNGFKFSQQYTEYASVDERSSEKYVSCEGFDNPHPGTYA